MSKQIKKCAYYDYMLCKTFLHTLVFEDASSPLFLTYCRFFFFAFPDNLAAENSKLSADSGIQRIQFLECMRTTSAIIIIFHHFINQIFLSANYRSMTSNDVLPGFPFGKVSPQFQLDPELILGNISVLMIFRSSLQTFHTSC